MDKGIRQGVNAKFAELLPELKTLGGKAFRRDVMAWAIDNYGISVASAATHYNYSLHKAKLETPALVTGLGRPEGKNNGGRKKKTAVAAAAAEVAGTTGETLPGANAATGEAAAAEGAAAAEQGDAAALPEGITTVETPVETAPKLVTVVQKKTGEVVAENVTYFDALDMIQKAKQGKKAALAIKE
jgi:hypothetical protein